MAHTSQPDADDPHPSKPATKTHSFAGIIVARERVFDVISSIITAIFTIVLAISTALLWKETKDLRNFAHEQSVDMKASIQEAGRAASAMEDVAKALALSSKTSTENNAIYKEANIRQMRAYLTLGLNAVIAQDKTTNYRFEIRLALQNVGNTPAYKVISATYVDILPFPLPTDFKFPDLTNPGAGDVVAPRESFIITGVANEIFSDEKISEIQNGPQRLYIYGTVFYEDLFGVSRHMNFCKAIIWLKNGNPMSLNALSHNEAN